MISGAIIQALKTDAEFASLCGGADRMFAEKGIGEPAVIVKQGSPVPILDASAKVYAVNVQCLVSGYSTGNAESIAETAIDKLLSFERTTMLHNSKKHEIKAIRHLNGPVLISWQDVNAMSVNFKINYSIQEN